MQGKEHAKAGVQLVMRRIRGWMDDRRLAGVGTSVFGHSLLAETGVHWPPRAANTTLDLQ